MLSQSIEGCLDGRIGSHGLSHAGLDAGLEKASAALSYLREAHENGELALLHMPERRDDLAAAHAAGERLLDGARDIIILGTGGSSLGAQALAQISGWRDPGSVAGHAPGQPRFHFFDNLDGASFSSALETLDLETARFVAVSKSGSTAETMMQTLSALDAVKKKGLKHKPERYFLGLTEPHENPMRRLLGEEGIELLEHDPAIGGRFSVLSNVGMLPAILLGLDPVEIRNGAGEILKPVLEGAAPDKCAPALGAVANVMLAREKDMNVTVMMSYSDHLERFSKWYVQLWAESLGKDGQGTTPVAAQGPVDQHSQLQLFLGGPRDKLVTLIMLEPAGSGPRIDKYYAEDPDIGYLAGHSLGDLVDCEQRATAKTLMDNGRPVRSINLAGLDERVMGELFMHFMLETIIAGHMMDINPFDQPAVEQGKVLAREYLARMAKEKA